MSVLVLGCGLVAPPLVQYLNSHGISQILASRTLSKTLQLKESLGNPDNIQVVEYDIELDAKESASLERLDKLVRESDPAVIVSLLPYVFHVQAAEVAIKYRKHFCTTSYVSPAMQELDAKAKELGLFFLNECGVDPGLDHMSAMKVIHSLGDAKLLGFRSICGGLPAPEFNNNPFGYKFSWSPRGVLLASNNSALIRQNGEDVSVAGPDLMAEPNVHSEYIEGVGQLEWYYNRNSVMYLDIYNIKDTPTIIRGTYRYAGWCRTLTAFKKLGLTTAVVNSKIAAIEGGNALQYIRTLLDTPEGKSAEQHVAEIVGISVDDEIIQKMTWLRMFDPTALIPKVSMAIDYVCFLLQSSLVYGEGEKDMIVMRHEFDIEDANGNRYMKSSTLVDIGQQPTGYSSMARTVTLPLAIAIRALLEGKIKLTGVIRPVQPEIYNLVLDEMESLGVIFQEKIEPVRFWLRDEVKPGEERVALTPTDARSLVERGFRVTVEKSVTRAFPDIEYVRAGCDLAPTGSWPNAPRSAIILGLKELPETPRELVHRHIYFAHCYKNQAGWKELLQRFDSGKGRLWDLEFLVNDSGRRIAAFGRAAGIVGMALGVIAYASRILKTPVKNLTSWKNSAELVDYTRNLLEKASPLMDRVPEVLVIGALGRCGGGATWFASQLGLKVIQWDLAETRRGGPFPELLDVDILVNCIYLTEKIAPFISREMLRAKPDRRLRVFSDVSCDATNPNNPVPVYDSLTSLREPVVEMEYGNERESSKLDVIAIDHLPTLIPYESSTEFSSLLAPHLLDLATEKRSPVWNRADKLYTDFIEKARS